MSNIVSVGIGSVTGLTTYIVQTWSEFQAATIVPVEFVEKIIVAIVVAFLGGVFGYLGKRACEWLFRKKKK